METVQGGVPPYGVKETLVVMVNTSGRGNFLNRALFELRPLHYKIFNDDATQSHFAHEC